MSRNYSKLINIGFAFYNGILLIIAGISALLGISYMSIAPFFDGGEIWWSGLGIAVLFGVFGIGLGYILIKMGLESNSKS